MGGKANMEDCVFCKIGTGEIQGLRICEDDEALAFMDISNDYDGHILAWRLVWYLVLPQADWLTR